MCWLEPEARCAIWLSRPKGKHGVGYDLVDQVWWRPCARRTVFGCKRSALVAHLRRPSPVLVDFCDACHQRRVGHPARPAFHDDIEIVSGDSDDTFRVECQVLRLAGICSRSEVDGPIYPLGSQRHDVWPPIWTHRRQPARMPVGSALFRFLSKPLIQAITYLRPGDKRRTVAIKIVLRLWLDLHRCHSCSPFLGLYYYGPCSFIERFPPQNCISVHLEILLPSCFLPDR